MLSAPPPLRYLATRSRLHAALRPPLPLTSPMVASLFVAPLTSTLRSFHLLAPSPICRRSAGTGTSITSTQQRTTSAGATAATVPASHKGKGSKKAVVKKKVKKGAASRPLPGTTEGQKRQPAVGGVADVTTSPTIKGAVAVTAGQPASEPQQPEAKQQQPHRSYASRGSDSGSPPSLLKGGTSPGGAMDDPHRPSHTPRRAQLELMDLRRELIHARLLLATAQQERDEAVRELARLRRGTTKNPHNPTALQRAAGKEDSSADGSDDGGTEADRLSDERPPSLVSTRTLESIEGALRKADRTAHDSVVALRAAHMSLLATQESLEIELRRLLAIGLKPDAPADDDGTTDTAYMMRAIDAAAIEAGARQLIRQNIPLKVDSS